MTIGRMALALVCLASAIFAACRGRRLSRAGHRHGGPLLRQFRRDHLTVLAGWCDRALADFGGKAMLPPRPAEPAAASGPRMCCALPSDFAVHPPRPSTFPVVALRACIYVVPVVTFKFHACLCRRAKGMDHRAIALLVPIGNVLASPPAVAATPRVSVRARRPLARQIWLVFSAHRTRRCQFPRWRVASPAA